MRVHISEMLSLVAFVCERGPLWKGKVVLYAGDNSTVRQWVCKRQSGSRAGRLLVRVLNLCEMNYGFTLVGVGGGLSTTSTPITSPGAIRKSSRRCS